MDDADAGPLKDHHAMLNSPVESDDFNAVNDYFARLPLSPLSPPSKRVDVNDDEMDEPSGVTTADRTAGDVRGYFDRLPYEESPSSKTTRRIVTEYGRAGKPFTGALAFGAPAGVMGFLASPEGQVLSPFAVRDDGALSEDSKAYMEVMLEFYLASCEYETTVRIVDFLFSIESHN